MWGREVKWGWNGSKKVTKNTIQHHEIVQYARHITPLVSPRMQFRARFNSILHDFLPSSGIWDFTPNTAPVCRFVFQFTFHFSICMLNFDQMHYKHGINFFFGAVCVCVVFCLDFGKLSAYKSSRNATWYSAVLTTFTLNRDYWLALHCLSC